MLCTESPPMGSHPQTHVPMSETTHQHRNNGATNSTGNHIACTRKFELSMLSPCPKVNNGHKYSISACISCSQPNGQALHFYCNQCRYANTQH